MFPKHSHNRQRTKKLSHFCTENFNFIQFSPQTSFRLLQHINKRECTIKLAPNNKNNNNTSTFCCLWCCASHAHTVALSHTTAKQALYAMFFAFFPLSLTRHLICWFCSKSLLISAIFVWFATNLLFGSHFATFYTVKTSNFPLIRLTTASKIIHRTHAQILHCRKHKSATTFSFHITTDVSGTRRSNATHSRGRIPHPNFCRCSCHLRKTLIHRKNKNGATIPPIERKNSKPRKLLSAKHTHTTSKL